MATINKFYEILKAIETELSTLTKIKTSIEGFKGTEAILLLPAGQELINQSHNKVNYRYTVAVAYKTSKKLNTRELTQKSADIIDSLNKTRVNVSTQKFFDPRVEDVDFSPEVEEDEEGVAGDRLDLLINFGVTTQEDL